MLRIAVAAGKIGELAGATPQLDQIQNSASGSVNWISGAALTAGGNFPKLLLGDLEAPVISAAPSLVKFQSCGFPDGEGGGYRVLATDPFVRVL